MAEFKKGVMVMLLKATHPMAIRWIGTPQILERVEYIENGIVWWKMNPPLICIDGIEMVWEEPGMRAIDGKPGDDDTLTWAGKPELTDAQLEACDDWVMGVER